jgi:hypothetical protein
MPRRLEVESDTLISLEEPVIAASIAIRDQLFRGTSECFWGQAEQRLEHSRLRELGTMPILTLERAQYLGGELGQALSGYTVTQLLQGLVRVVGHGWSRSQKRTETDIAQGAGEVPFRVLSRMTGWISVHSSWMTVSLFASSVGSGRADSSNLQPELGR